MNRDAYFDLRAAGSRGAFVRQQGLSLVELLIGLLIGLILLGGVLQTMLASRDASSARQGMATITENARFLFEFMGRDLRMAGRGYDWPAFDTDELAYPLTLDGTTLRAGYVADVDDDGTDEFVVVEYEIDGNTIEYSRSVDGVGFAGEALITGVNNFGFVFGLYDEASDTFTYKANPAGAEWEQVIAVRVTVTFTDTTAGGLSGPLPDSTISSTIALRNRVNLAFAPGS